MIPSFLIQRLLMNCNSTDKVIDNKKILFSCINVYVNFSQIYCQQFFCNFFNHFDKYPFETAVLTAASHSSSKKTATAKKPVKMKTKNEKKRKKKKSKKVLNKYKKLY